MTTRDPDMMVTAQDVEALFAQYGMDATVHFDGTREQGRAQRLADEINSGQRTLGELNSLLSQRSQTSSDTTDSGVGFGATDDLTVDDPTSGAFDYQDILNLFALYGVDPALHNDGSRVDPVERAKRIANEVISGQRTLADVTMSIATISQTQGTGNTDPIFGAPVTGGATTIRAGGTLYQVRDSRTGEITYHVVYDFEGLQISYEIGDQVAFQNLFPNGGGAVFEATRVLTQQAFDDEIDILAGSVDEVIGQGDSLGSDLVTRLRAFGLESLPSWLRDDPQAMLIAATGAVEGWSAGRTLRELSQTEGFQARFGAWDFAISQTGGDEVAALQWLKNRELELQTVLSSVRGPNTNTDTSYVQDLINQGWTGESMRIVLTAERTFLSNPDMLDNLNDLLEAQGSNPITSDAIIAMIASGEAGIQDQVDFTDLLNGNNFSDVVDIINDAMIAAELEAAGLGDFDIDFVRSLRNVTSGILTQESIGAFVSQAAANVLRFIDDIDRDRFGLTEEDVVAAAAGRPSRGRSPRLLLPRSSKGLSDPAKPQPVELVDSRGSSTVKDVSI